MTRDLKNILVVDIETVATEKAYKDLQPRMQKEWDKKASYMQRREEATSEELFSDRAGIFAEFGKIVTVAVGFFTTTESGGNGFRVKAFASHSEKKLLEEFKALLDSRFDDDLALCAHNGKEFDFPYLCRRMTIHGMELPMSLDNSGKKPWEVNHIDTMELWKFGDRKSFTSLDLLAALFDIDSSKEDIDGSMVNAIYYQEDGLERIAKYCMQDVVVTAQLFLKLKNVHTFSLDDVKYLPVTIS